MSPKEQFSLLAHTSSLQLVTSLPNLNKGWAKWHTLVSDPWDSSTKQLDQLFKPKRSLVLPSIFFVYVDFYYECFVWYFERIYDIFLHVGKEGCHMVEWVDKVLWTCLKKLFEIDQAEQKCGEEFEKLIRAPLVIFYFSFPMTCSSHTCS